MAMPSSHDNNKTCNPNPGIVNNNEFLTLKALPDAGETCNEMSPTTAVVNNNEFLTPMALLDADETCNENTIEVRHRIASSDTESAESDNDTAVRSVKTRVSLALPHKQNLQKLTLNGDDPVRDVDSDTDTAESLVLDASADGSDKTDHESAFRSGSNRYGSPSNNLTLNDVDADRDVNSDTDSVDSPVAHVPSDTESANTEEGANCFIFLNLIYPFMIH